MENKKTKLTISGSPKKSFKNFETSKTKGKKTVVIDKPSSRSLNKGGFNKIPGSNFKRNPSSNTKFAPKTQPVISDFERQEDQAYQDKVRQEEQQDRVDLLTIEIQGKLDIEAAKASDIANRISLAEPLHEELGEVIAQKQQLFANPNASLEDKTSLISLQKPSLRSLDRLA